MLQYLIIVLIIIFIVEIFKRIRLIKSRFIPLVDIVMGIVFIFAYYDNLRLEQGLLYGVILGLATAGAFDLFRSGLQIYRRMKYSLCKNN